MLHMPISEVIKKIKEKGGISEVEIKEKIQKKLESLDGLVSEEGAAYIVASDLGIKLFKQAEAKELKVKDILVGMRNVNITCKITKIFETRKFIRNGKTNQVSSMMIGDETGVTRLVLWNDYQIQLVTENKIKEGSVIKIKNGYVKDNKFSGKEIHIGTHGQIILNIDEEIEVKGQDKSDESIIDELVLIKIKEGNNRQKVKVIGSVVRVFNPAFYDSCPECRRKVIKDNDKFICNDHEEVDAIPSMVFNFVLDDGSDSIRCVAFQNTAEKLSGLTAKEAKEKNENQILLQEELNNNLLGKDLELEGNIRENQAFERKELIISKSSIPNPILIAKNLLEAK